MELCLPMVSPKNVKEVVALFKKELIKTSGTDNPGDKEYKQEYARGMIRTIGDVNNKSQLLHVECSTDGKNSVRLVKLIRTVICPFHIRLVRLLATDTVYLLSVAPSCTRSPHV